MYTPLTFADSSLKTIGKNFSNGEIVWLTQAQMSVLFETTKRNVSLHINKNFKENELEREVQLSWEIQVFIDVFFESNKNLLIYSVLHCIGIFESNKITHRMGYRI